MSLVNKTTQTINAQVLRDEVAINGNTSLRVYNLIKNVIDSMVDFTQLVFVNATGVDTLVATVAGIEAYSATAIYLLRNTSANTGAATLNITVIGAKALKDNKGKALVLNSLLANSVYLVVYDSVNDWFQIVAGFSNDARIQTVTSAATVTANVDTDDAVHINAQAVGLTLANPTGTPSPDYVHYYRIKDNGSAQTIAWGSDFRRLGGTLPSTTIAGKLMYAPCMWNDEAAKWDVLNIINE